MMQLLYAVLLVIAPGSTPFAQGELSRQTDTEVTLAPKSCPASDRSCALSTEIFLRDRWSSCVERQISEKWLEPSRFTNLSAKREAQRLFRDALRGCAGDGEAFRAFAGNKAFRSQRNYMRDMTVDTLELTIVAERTSEI